MSQHAGTLLAAVLTVVALTAAAVNANDKSCWHGLPQPQPTKDNPRVLSCLHYDALHGPGTTECVYATIKTIGIAKFNEDPTNAGPLLRLAFHDAFLNGADGSVLLNATYGKKDGDSERDETTVSETLDGFDIIDEIKEAVDKKCGPVSCADIVAITAMWMVNLTGGPEYEVPLGRLDGCVSEASLVPSHLPSPQATVRKVYNGAPYSLINAFKVVGLNTQDLVVLSGAHTIGQAHCSNYKDRINYGGKTSPEPINATLQHQLQQCCIYQKPQPGNPTGSCQGNISSPVRTDAPQTDLEAGNATQRITYPPTGGGLTFDNSYFKNIQRKMGLLTSDQALFSDPSTRYFVDAFAASQPAFFSAFQKSIVRMLSVLPVTAGVEGGAGMPPCSSHQAANATGLPVCLAYPKNAYGIRVKTCSSAKYSDYCKAIL